MINKKMYNIFIIMYQYLFYFFSTITVGILINKMHNFINFKNTIKKIKSSDININHKVEILKNKYNIKSTEKTNNYLNYIVNCPTHLNINNPNINNPNIFKINYLNNNDLKKLSNNIISKNIISIYIFTKKIFFDLFYDNNNKYLLNSLKDFYEFQKKNILKNNLIKYNIILKFYSGNQYLYIYVNKSNLIKIKKFDEYDKICSLIEKSNNVFLIKDNKNDLKKYYLSLGGYISKNINKNELERTFFNNKNKDNKNYKILSNFSNIKIYFFVSSHITVNK